MCTITIWHCVGSNAVQESVQLDRNVWYTFTQWNMELNHSSVSWTNSAACGGVNNWGKSTSVEYPEILRAELSISESKLEHNLVGAGLTTKWGNVLTLAQSFPTSFFFLSLPTILNLSIRPPPSQLPRYHSAQSQLYPPPSIWLYCRLGMPGMSTGSPILSVHTQSTMQAHAWACTCGFSTARRVSSGRPGTDTRRRGQIGFNQTSVTAPSPRLCLLVCHCEQVVPRSQIPTWDFTSARSARDLSFCVGWHWGNHVARAKYSCRASLDEKTDSSAVGPTFFCWGSVEVGPPRGRNRSSRWMLGKCVRIWASVIPERENLSECIPSEAHTLTQTRMCTSTRIHALLAGNDGWCAWNSPTLRRPLPPLDHLWWE